MTTERLLPPWYVKPYERFRDEAVPWEFVAGQDVTDRTEPWSGLTKYMWKGWAGTETTGAAVSNPPSTTVASHTHVQSDITNLAFPSGLPAVTVDDNDKLLTVSAGAWTVGFARLHA